MAVTRRSTATQPLPSPLSPIALRTARPLRVLCLGAHADDIEIGCGGTLLRLLSESPAVDLSWHVFSAPGPRRAEARRSALAWTRGAKSVRLEIGRFKESYFPHAWARVKDHVAGLRRDFEPDIVFSHARHDRHQDHQVLAELTWNTFRDHTILEYEIPKYEGDLGRPNVYVALDEPMCQRKVRALMSGFPTQRAKPWFTEDTFWALLRLRGLESGRRVRFAEAFYGSKIVL